jgi:outer membrane protein assembly factor BamB
MKKLFVITIFLFVSGCSYHDISTYLGLSKSTASYKEINNIQAELLWSSDIGESRDYKTAVLQPVFFNGISYSIDNTGYVSAVDLQNGNLLWEYDLDLKVSSGLGLHDDKLFFGTNDGLYFAFDISSINKPYSILNNLNFVNILNDSMIEPYMKIQLKSEASSPAVGIDDLIFIKTDDGDTVAIDFIDKSIAWIYKGRNVPLSIKGSGSIGILNNNIYVPRDDGNLISLLASSGKLNWLVSISPRSGRNELESLRDIEVAPVIDNGILYIGSYQGNLIAVDIFNGNIIWSRPMSIMSQMTVDDKAIYVSDYSGSVHALDRYDGSVLWTESMTNSIIPIQTFVMNESVISLTTSGHIFILNKNDGKILTFKKILGEIDPQSRGVLSDKYLYIVSKNGRLNAIKIN